VSELLSDEALRADFREYLKLYDMMVDSLLLVEVDDYIAETLDARDLPSDAIVKQFEPRPPKRPEGGNGVMNGGGRRRSKKSDKVGRLGEEWVFEFEKKRLISLGLQHLAEKVELHRESATARTPGWDITSFDDDGSLRRIEVKSRDTERRRVEIVSRWSFDFASEVGLCFTFTLIQHQPARAVYPRISRGQAWAGVCRR
jgi:hypothetical protein